MRSPLALLLLCSCVETHDVATKTEYGVSGLATAANPVVGVPPGALSIASQNIAIRRAGMVQPRPGFKTNTINLGGDNENFANGVWKLLPFDDDYMVIGQVGVAVNTFTSEGTLLSALTGRWTKHQVRGVEVRKNLYLTTNDRQRKLTAAGDNVAAAAGVQQPTGGNASLGTGASIGAGETVAYRWVIRRTDANNLIARSAPSSRILFNNNTGGAVGVTVTGNFGTNSDVAAGDVAELYRSFSATTSTPPDELFYVTEVPLASGDITNGYVVFPADAVINVDLGVALYTNSTQEGIARSNQRPPLAKDLALFAGSLFAANITRPHLYEVNWISGGNKSASATGIGTRTYTGTRTNTSNQITGLSSVVGLKIGQLLYNPGGSWSGSGGVRITNIVGATLTMSETWSGTTDGAPASLMFTDSIRIKTASEDQYYPVTLDFLDLMLVGSAGLSTTYRCVKSSYTTVRFLGDSVSWNSSALVTGIQETAVFQQLLPSSPGFQIWATHGSEYTPALPEPTVTNGLASTQDSFQNALTWTKEQEPEHWLGNALWFVGNAKSPILRIVPLRDGLYIFKGRGDYPIWKLTGFGELSGWRVDALDTSTYLLHPELVVALEDSLYAWTNTGMCRVDASGQQMLNIPIHDLTDDLEIALDPNLTTAGYSFGAANPQDHEVIFGLATGNDDNTLATRALVYNTLNDAWYPWLNAGEPVPTAMAFDPATRLLMYGTFADSKVRLARDPTDPIQFADADTAITVNSNFGAGSLVIAGGSGYSPAVGDLLVSGTHYGIVTAVTNSTTFTVSDAAFPTGAATAYASYQSRVSWLPVLDPDGAAVKRYESMIAHWDDTQGMLQWSSIFETTQNSGTEYTIPDSTTYARGAQVRLDSRAMMGRNASFATQLYPSISVKQADARWRLSGITVYSEDSSTVPRR